jgi:hypothetical protein
MMIFLSYYRKGKEFFDWKGSSMIFRSGVRNGLDIPTGVSA